MEVDWRDLDVFTICSVIDYISGDIKFEDSERGRLVRQIADLIMPLPYVAICNQCYPRNAPNRGGLIDIRISVHQCLIDSCSEIRTLAQIRKVTRIHRHNFSSRLEVDKSPTFVARKLHNGLCDFQQAAVDHIANYNDTWISCDHRNWSQKDSRNGKKYL